MNAAEDPPPEFDEPVAWPITGELDLHAFQPGEMKSLLPDYFAECLQRGISPVRVIHGKGTGALREGVHRLLQKLPMVASWQWPAGAASGGWGATWVWLQPAAENTVTVTPPPAEPETGGAQKPPDSRPPLRPK